MLARPMKDGKTTYMQHLQSVVRQTGGRVVPEELRNRTEKPERAVYLWNYFTQLSAKRSHDGFSGIPQRITSAEMLAWATLHRVPLQTFEVELLEKLDETFIDVRLREIVATREREEKSKTAKEAKSERPARN